MSDLVAAIRRQIRLGEWEDAQARTERLRETFSALRYQSQSAEALVGLMCDELQRKHRVDCSIFAPPVVRRGAEIVVQVLVHLKRDLIQAARLALSKDQSANRRAFATLEMELKAGTEVDFFMGSE